MTDNFVKDINVPSKEIIIKFSDGYCIVLENNEVSIRENAFTKYCIEYGKQTNELLEFVKELYLNKKAKEQECEKINQALDEIEKQVKAMNNECFYDDICDCNNCDMKNGCSYYRKFKIINIINKVKEQ